MKKTLSVVILILFVLSVNVFAMEQIPNGDKQKQQQKQKQKQQQKQKQKQQQKTDIKIYNYSEGSDSEGVFRNQTIEDAKNPIPYGHIDSGVQKTDADMLESSGNSNIRLMSSLFKYDDDKFITMDEAKNASNGADIDVIKALINEPDVELASVRWDGNVSGKYIGSITLTTEDATTDQILAQACEEAMKAGATSIKIETSNAQIINGVKYGFDLGSSASVAVNPDTGSAVIAPGATLGWSKAKADNKWVNEVFIVLFHDETLLKKVN